MTEGTLNLLRGIVKAALPDAREREEALRLLTPPRAKGDRRLTTKQACALAGCCAKTLFRWEKKGHVHATRATRSHVRWSQAELEGFLGTSEWEPGA